MSKPKVLLMGLEGVLDSALYDEYSKLFEFVNYDLSSKDQLLLDFKGPLSDIEGVLSSMPGFIPLGGLRGDLVDALPPKLRIMCTPTVGHDHYDGEALRKRDIVLCNTPSVSGNEVADIALHLALSTYRYTSLFEHSLRAHKNTLKARYACLNVDAATGQFAPPPGVLKFAYGHDIGKTLVSSPGGQIAGIAGFGTIGRAIARRLHAIGMHIHYLKRSPLSEKEESELSGIPLVRHESFESLAKVSQLLVMVLPMSPQTRHILNSETIALMPDGAKVVNVGRGLTIDHDALLAGLRSGKLSSVGVDVYEYEPAVNMELMDRYDVTVLPHVGSCTNEQCQEALELGLLNLKSCLIENGPGNSPVN